MGTGATLSIGETFYRIRSDPALQGALRRARLDDNDVVKYLSAVALSDYSHSQRAEAGAEEKRLRDSGQCIPNHFKDLAAYSSCIAVGAVTAVECEFLRAAANAQYSECRDRAEAAKVQSVAQAVLVTGSGDPFSISPYDLDHLPTTGIAVKFNKVGPALLTFLKGAMESAGGGASVRAPAGPAK